MVAESPNDLGHGRSESLRAQCETLHQFLPENWIGLPNRLLKRTDELCGPHGCDQRESQLRDDSFERGVWQGNFPGRGCLENRVKFHEVLIV